MAPRKSHPKGIDPAYPQKNFVQAAAENHGEDYYESLYPMYGSAAAPVKKASHFGHSIGQRAGKLRLSGMKGAHRIGKR